MPETDYDLIVACRQGDTRAWGRVLESYERLVFSIPLNYGLSRDDAADIAQLTFTIFMQSLDTLREDSHLASWLATVARRHSWRLLERRRRESTDPEENLADKATLHAQADPERYEERLELLQWLDQGLRLLDQKCRTLLLALYFDPEEPSYAEIAEAIGVAVGSIGPTRARCLKRMKELLTAIE